MSVYRFEIDCSKEGVTGHNMTGQLIDTLKPYLYRIDAEGSNDNIDISADDPKEANFKLIEMNDVRMVKPEQKKMYDGTLDESYDDTQVTIYFRAVVEFNLEFEPDSEYGGNFFKNIFEEAEWIIKVSSNNIGLETSDGIKDNDSFDGGCFFVKKKKKSV